MGDARHDLGIAADGAVAAWLGAAGWRILARRYRSAAGGEVDLIAVDPA
ncbi:MAG: YraN family protein, partial [Acidobacteriota bacterium]|nr:YraN family protein [Acidobacteriota bacterium]